MPGAKRDMLGATASRVDFLPLRWQVKVHFLHPFRLGFEVVNSLLNAAFRVDRLSAQI
jgi:hypothetical protein